MNEKKVTGNIGKDNASTHTFPSGKSVTEFSLADNYKQRGEEVTTWHKVKVWGDKGKELEPKLTRGRFIQVIGREEFETYQTRDGKNVMQPVIHADRVDLDPEIQRKEDRKSDDRSDPSYDDPF